jgi:thiosulfate dehydrogenase
MRAPLLLLALAGCGDHVISAASAGEERFSDPKLSTSPLNHFSCATCHQVSSASPPMLQIGALHPGKIDPGYDLHGAVHRPTWWGGYETELLDSFNYCLVEFMGGAKLAPEQTEARELYEWLASNSPEPSSPALPLTVVENVSDLSAIKGDATRGQDVFARACKSCHGEPHTGVGKIDPRVSTVPEDTEKIFPTQARAVVVEKTRHGRFFNIGGIMPLFSAEAISDPEIADILAYLGL